MATEISSRSEIVEDLGRILMKAIEFVNIAHAILLPKSPEAANQLAKVSNDISDVYIDVYAARYSSPSPVSGLVTSPSSPLGEIRTYPPGLFKNVEEAKAHARANVNANDLSSSLKMQMMLGNSSNVAADYLHELDGEAFINIMLCITSPWGMARILDILRLNSSDGNDLWKTFATVLDHMTLWDRQLLFDSVRDSRSPQKAPEVELKVTHAPIDTPESTWAEVAAIPDVASNTSAPVISLVTSPIQHKAPKIEPMIAQPTNNEPMEFQQRVVFVHGCKRGTTLGDITKRIREGPLMSILLEKDPSRPGSSACIIFHMAKHALEFVRTNRLLLQTTGRTRYGFGVTVVQGGPWPEDAEIRSMNDRERRRLTFSGSGLFCRITRDMFQNDISAIAGEHNVEMIWLFNTGNATVVLASVRVARAVRARVLERGGVYEDVTISFSLDPCEKELRLVTQMVSGPEVEEEAEAKA